MSINRVNLTSKIFNLDNGIMRVFSRIIDIVILNILFIICCIPLITIGASLTSMYSITLKMVKNEDCHIIREFFKAFKQNLRQGTIVGIIAIIIVAIITVDLTLIGFIGDERLKVIQILCYSVGIWAYIIFLYAFPILARFSLNTKEVLKNSLILSVINIKYTLLLISFNIPFVLMLLYSGVSMLLLFTILIIFGFSGIALIQSFFFRKIFRKYETEII